MDPQRCPRPDLQNLWICYLTWQMEIKVANQMTLNREIVLDYPARRGVIFRVLKNGQERQKREGSEWCGVKRTQLAVSGFEDEVQTILLSLGRVLVIWLHLKDVGTGCFSNSPLFLVCLSVSPLPSCHSPLPSKRFRPPAFPWTVEGISLLLLRISFSDTELWPSSSGLPST